MNTAKSVNGVTIQLPAERWVHITEEHAELAGYFYDVLETIQEPLVVFEGNTNELLAAREIENGITSSSFIENQVMRMALSLRPF
jgi:hypothetical protein